MTPSYFNFSELGIAQLSLLIHFSHFHERDESTEKVEAGHFTDVVPNEKLVNLQYMLSLYNTKM